MDRHGLWSYRGPNGGFRAVLSARREALESESLAYWRNRTALVEIALNAYWREHLDASEASGRLEQALAEARAMLRELERLDSAAQ